MTTLHLHFDPLLPLWGLISLGILSILVLLTSIINGASKGVFWRFCVCAVLLTWLANPLLLKYQKQNLPQTILIIVDHSDSMKIGNRLQIATNTLDTIQKNLPPDIRTKVVTITNINQQGTQLFPAINKAMSDIPINQLGGILVISDGQIHDVPMHLPKTLTILDHQIPIYVLLTASQEQIDRSLKILHAPTYSMVGKDATIQLQVNDTPPSPTDKKAILTINREDQQPITQSIPIGTPQTINVPITHTGNTLLELSVSPLKGEISQFNNHQVIHINGMRDKLKVLLVSSSPNQGERAWRNLLKSDPSVELIHFIILRSAEQSDDTPESELALIPFPVDELFINKISLFDLIILDNFENRNALPYAYIANIASYVKKGGGLLLIAGPEFTGQYSLQNSPLNSILPASVSSPKDIITTPFQAQLTAIGRKHPVTKELDEQKMKWGHWYRYLKANNVHGNVLMQAPDQSPLLIVNHVEHGRIALLLSDQIWLWSKAEPNSGPQTQLLRRLAHWLMKEPELEEQQLTATLHDKQLTIKWYTIANNDPTDITITSPSGQQHTITLIPKNNGVGEISFPAKEDGIWKITNGSFTAYAAPQTSDPIEMTDLAVTAKKLAPLVNDNKIHIHWLGDNETQLHIPTIRVVDTDNLQINNNFMDFQRLTTYITTQRSAHHLLPAWAALLIGFGSLLLAWYKESVS